MEGKQYKHKNGNIYTVLFLTNDGGARPDHPVDVVYIGQNGKIWSRRLSDWGRSFTEVSDIDRNLQERLARLAPTAEALKNGFRNIRPTPKYPKGSTVSALEDFANKVSAGIEKMISIKEKPDPLQDLYDLPLHEVFYYEDQNLDILRVPGGWIYKLYQEVYERESGNYRQRLISSIFVPEPKPFQSKKYGVL